MSPNPEPIFQMLQGSQVTAILRAGIEHAVFDSIAAGNTTAAEVAGDRDCDPRGTAILLDALSSLGLLARDGQTYSLTPLSETYLRSDKPTYVGGLSKIFGSPHLSEQLDKLGHAVSNGGTVTDKHAETPDHPFWSDFAEGSGSMAGPAAAMLAELVAPWLSQIDGASVLDAACGSGMYGHTVGVKCDSVQVVSQDWPNVLEKTRAVAGRTSLGDRVSYIPGNLFEVDLEGPHHLVIASHIFHHFDVATCQQLMVKLGEATASGGKIAIHEFITGDSPADDPGPFLFSALMLTWTKGGQAYNRDHYAAWLTEAGFGEPELHDSAGLPTQFLIASKR